jgi:hypothetical protein
MKATGDISGKTLMQLAKEGVPAWEILAKAIGTDVPTAMQLAKDKSINANKAIIGMTQEMGEKYKEAAEEQNNIVGNLLGTIEAKTKSIMAAVGADITKAFDLKERLNKAIGFLDEFKGKVETSGLRQTLIDEIPAGVMATSVGTIAAALMSQLIPAFKAARAAVLAFNAATGAISLGGVIGLAVTAASALATYKYAEYEKNPIETQRGYIQQEYDAGNLSEEQYSQYMAGFDEQAQAAAKRIEELRQAEEKLRRETDAAGGSAGSMAEMFIDGAGASGKEMDKLSREVKFIHEAIERDWLQTTQTNEAQTDGWYSRQLATLNNTKDANENYLTDLEKLNAAYAERKKQAQERDAQQEYEDLRKQFDRQRKFKEEAESLNGRKALLATNNPDEKQRVSLEIDFTAQKEKMLEHYRDLTAQVNAMTGEQKERFKADWQEAGLFFEENENGILEFKKQMALEEETLEQEKLARIQEMTENHYAWMKDAHKSAVDYMAEISNGMYSGLQTSIKGLLDGSMSISEAWENLRGTMLGTLVQMAAQAIASNLMVALLGKPIAAATAAAWAPAAAMVSLATMGANSAAANAGIVATSALAQGFAGAGGLAEGGMVRGRGTGTSDSIPTMLSNGEYVLRASAVSKIGKPLLDTLNRGGVPRFATGGLVTGPSLSSLSADSLDFSAGLPTQGRSSGIVEQARAQTNINISAVDAKSVEALLRRNGGALVRSLSEQAALFNTGGLRPV